MTTDDEFESIQEALVERLLTTARRYASKTGHGLPEDRVLMAIDVAVTRYASEAFSYDAVLEVLRLLHEGNGRVLERMEKKRVGLDKLRTRLIFKLLEQEDDEFIEA